MKKTTMGHEQYHQPFAVGKPRSKRPWILLSLALAALAYQFIELPVSLSPAAPWSSAHKSYAADATRGICAQPQPAGEPSNYSLAYSSPEFRLESAQRLAGAVKIPTMSFDDMGPVGEDPRWAPFDDMHQYLRSTFPTLHGKAELNVIGGYSLVYKLQGSSSELKPLMLMGHLDVVPSITSLDRWTHPPFSGTVDGEWIYGRGSGDCKNNVIGILTAVEHLLNSGWTPHRTLVLAFGQDEEISGAQGAINIGPYLEGLFGKNGIAMIIDEGGMGLETRYGTEFALPGIAEKGHGNYRIEVDMLGGHASIPSQHTSIGILSKIVSSIEDSDVFHPTLRRESPLWGYLSCLAQHGDSSDVPPWIKRAVFEEDPDMAAAAAEFAQTSLANRYLIQTSKAATVFNAGIKNNALAESAVVNINTRIEIFSTPQEVQDAYLALIQPVAKRYSLLLNGQSLSSEPSIGNITFGWSDVQSPTPISPLASTAWTIFSRSVQASFGPNVIAAPSAMTGNTDTRFYLNLTRNIYRWSPARTGTKLNIHTVDEMIKIDTHVDGIRFYTELIIQADGITSDENL